MNELSPFVLYFISALLVLASQGNVRKIILLATPVLTGLHLWFNLDAGSLTTYSIMD